MGKLEIFRDGELYLVRRNDLYSVHGMQDGRRIRQACRTRDLHKAKLILESMKREYESGWSRDYDDPDRDWMTIAETACERQKGGAKKRGIPFDLRPGDVYSLMKSTGFRCAVSGIPLAKRMVLGGKRDPWAPSIDRIESRHGYTLDNVRIVTLAANIAMNEWGQDTLLRLARGVVRSSTQLSDEPKVVPQLTPTKPNTSEINALS